MDAEKTFKAILHHVNTSYSPEHLQICKDMAWDHFMKRTRNEKMYVEIMWAIGEKERLPNTDCSYFIPEQYEQTK